jgi:hypothetical protein
MRHPGRGRLTKLIHDLARAGSPVVERVWIPGRGTSIAGAQTAAKAPWMCMDALQQYSPHLSRLGTPEQTLIHEFAGLRHPCSGYFHGQLVGATRGRHDLLGRGSER